MTGTYVTIEVLGVKYILDTAVETIKILEDLNVSATTPQSFTDQSTGADYQVPVGKTFKCLGVLWGDMATAGSVLIYQGDTADAITLLKATIGTAAGNQPKQLPASFTIAAQKYVTHDASAANVCADMILVGIEY